MPMPVFAGWVITAMTIARGATKLTFLFVFNMFVLFAEAGGAVAVAGGIAEATFGHWIVPVFEVTQKTVILQSWCDIT